MGGDSDESQLPVEDEVIRRIPTLPTFDSSLDDDGEDEMGTFRKCANCGVIEPLQRRTQMSCKAQIGLSCVFLDDRADDCRSEMTPKSERKTGVDGVETVTMDVTSDSTMVASGDGGADEGGVVEEMDSGDWGSPGPPENIREVPPAGPPEDE